MADASTSYGSSTNGNKPCCHPANPLTRFIALIFMCFLCFGSYFCYDTPGALADSFKNDLKLSTTQLVLLYSIYSWPNVIMCFIGGFLTDRYFGVRLGTLIFMTILTIGALIFATGAYVNKYWLMVVGRFIFGIGGESLAVAVNNYAVLWFKGKELNMVFGLQLSFSRIGSTVNFVVMEPLYNSVKNHYHGPQRIGVVLFLASLTCVFSLVCGLCMWWMDFRAERLSNRNAASERNNNEPVRLTDVRYFRATFWLLSIICVAYYVAIFPFIALGKLFFERKFDFSPATANAVNSIVYSLSAVLSPLFGILIDKTGMNVSWVMLSIVTTIAAHALLAFTFVNPFAGMCLMGFSYSLLASGLWPLVALIVPDNQLGSAYGICQAVQNLGLAVVTILAGMIVDKYGYLMLEMFFMAWLFVALLAAILIFIVDSTGKGVLNLTPKKREALNNTSEETDTLLDNEEVTEPDAPERLEDSIQAQSERIRNSSE